MIQKTNNNSYLRRILEQETKNIEQELLRTKRGKGLSREEQEDAVQETFLNILQYEQSYHATTTGTWKENKELQRWIGSIFYNNKKKRVKQRIRQEPYEEELTTITKKGNTWNQYTKEEPTKKLEEQEEQKKLQQQYSIALQLLWSAYNTLIEEKKNILWDKEAEEQTYQEITKKYNLNTSAAKSRVHRARKHLKKTLEQLST